MRITRAQLQRIIKEELNEMASLRGGTNLIPLFDEEAEAIRHVLALAELYEPLKRSPHTAQAMQLVPAFMWATNKIKGGQMDIYTMVAMAAALKELGIRDPGPAKREEPEEEDL